MYVVPIHRSRRRAEPSSEKQILSPVECLQEDFAKILMIMGKGQIDCEIGD